MIIFYYSEKKNSPKLMSNSWADLVMAVTEEKHGMLKWVECVLVCVKVTKS